MSQKTELEFANVFLEDVCNFGLLPIPMLANPTYLTVKQLIEKPDTTPEDMIISQFYDYSKRACAPEKREKKKKLFDAFALFVNDENIKDCDFLKTISKNGEFLSWRYARPSGDNRFGYKKSEWIKSMLLLFSSIQKNGYDPEQFVVCHPNPIRSNIGQVTGHLLQEGNTKKYFITQGQRRTAIFFALNPTKSIKVLLDQNEFFKEKRLHPRKEYIEQTFKKQYLLSGANEWPSVKSGFLSEKDAQTMFKLFLYSDDTWVKKEKDFRDAYRL